MLSFFANRLKDVPFHISYRPTYILSQVLGILPYSMTNSDNTQKKTSQKTLTIFEFSFPLSLITLIWAIAYLVAYVFANESVLAVPSSRDYPIISVVGHLMHIYLGICIFITSYIFTPRKIYRYNTLALRLKYLDEELTSICGKSVDFRTTVVFQLIFIAGGGLVIALALIFDYLVFMEMYGNYMIVICFAYIYPYVCSGVIHLQFIAIIHSIYQRFNTINM